MPTVAEQRPIVFREAPPVEDIEVPGGDLPDAMGTGLEALEAEYQELEILENDIRARMGEYHRMITELATAPVVGDIPIGPIHADVTQEMTKIGEVLVRIVERKRRLRIIIERGGRNIGFPDPDTEEPGPGSDTPEEPGDPDAVYSPSIGDYAGAALTVAASFGLGWVIRKVARSVLGKRAMQGRGLERPLRNFKRGEFDTFEIEVAVQTKIVQMAAVVFANALTTYAGVRTGKLRRTVYVEVPNGLYDHIVVRMVWYWVQHNAVTGFFDRAFDIAFASVYSSETMIPEVTNKIRNMTVNGTRTPNWRTRSYR